jgi:hypothetical protein
MGEKLVGKLLCPLLELNFLAQSKSHHSQGEGTKETFRVFLNQAGCPGTTPGVLTTESVGQVSRIGSSWGVAG